MKNKTQATNTANKKMTCGAYTTPHKSCWFGECALWGACPYSKAVLAEASTAKKA